jgi:hypothetical protein
VGRELLRRRPEQALALARQADRQRRRVSTASGAHRSARP